MMIFFGSRHAHRVKNALPKTHCKNALKNACANVSVFFFNCFSLLFLSEKVTQQKKGKTWKKEGVKEGEGKIESDYI
jgi:hypothetical protein